MAERATVILRAKPDLLVVTEPVPKIASDLSQYALPTSEDIAANGGSYQAEPLHAIRKLPDVGTVFKLITPVLKDKGEEKKEKKETKKYKRDGDPRLVPEDDGLFSKGVHKGGKGSFTFEELANLGYTDVEPE